MVPISFCRWLIPELRAVWNKILEDILDTQFVSDQDIVSWKLEGKGKFFVKSTYNALTCFEGGPHLNIFRKERFL